MEASGCIKRKKKNLIIKVPTKELWKKVVRKAIKEGCKWRGGGKDINLHFWNGKQTAICIEEKRLTYASFGQALVGNLAYPTVLTAQEYLQSKW